MTLCDEWTGGLQGSSGSPDAIVPGTLKIDGADVEGVFYGTPGGKTFEVSFPRTGCPVEWVTSYETSTATVTYNPEIEIRGLQISANSTALVGGNSVSFSLGNDCPQHQSQHTCSWRISPSDGLTFTSSGYGALASGFTVAQTYTITATLTNSDVSAPVQSGSASCELSVDVIRVDLAAKTISHNLPTGELSESEEETVGAFLPLNNDDDDYTAVPGGADGADKDQSGTITGENDLLPIVLHKLATAISGAKYTLEIPRNVRIWQIAERSGAVSGTTEFDANEDTTLHVEGVVHATGNIKLKLKQGSTTLGSDTLKVTVFNWTGPLNVPGYSAYEYQASVGISGVSTWIDPVGGTIQDLDTSHVTILWDSGPVAGKAVYKYNDNYIWDLDVNVVEVAVNIPASVLRSYEAPVQDVVNHRRILARGVDSQHSVDSRLYVSRIRGVNVGGVPRGVKFIEMGFIQNAQVTASHATFDFVTPMQSVRNLQNGNTYLDYEDNAGYVRHPWFIQGDGTQYLNPTTDRDDALFTMWDNPRLTGTHDMGGHYNGWVRGVDNFHITFDATLYFAVCTKDTRLAANTRFTQRASGQWQFDGSGDINATGIWQGPGLNWASGSLSEVNDGSMVPVTDPEQPVMNALLRATESWSWVPAP